MWSGLLSRQSTYPTPLHSNELGESSREQYYCSSIQVISFVVQRDRSNYKQANAAGLEIDSIE